MDKVRWYKCKDCSTSICDGIRREKCYRKMLRDYREKIDALKGK